MVHYGSKIHESIQDKVSEVENEHKGFNRKIYDSEAKITKAIEDREDILGKLAMIYLPEAEAEELKGKVREAQAEVKAIFKEKQDRRKKLEGLVETTLESVASMKDKLDGLAK